MRERFARLAKAAPLVVDAIMRRGDVDSPPSYGIRHFLASVVTTLLDVSLFQILVWSETTPILWASGVSFCVALVTNYILASGYVYRHLVGTKVWSWPRFLAYSACALVSLGLTQLVIWLLAVRLGLYPLFAKMIAVAVLFFLNLWMARRILFNPGISPKERR